MAGNQTRKFGSEFYTNFIHTVPDIIYEVDVNGCFVFLNDAIRNLGYTPRELLGKKFREIVHPDDFKSVSRSMILPEYKGKVTDIEGAPKLFDERRTGERVTRNLHVRLALKDSGGSTNEYRYVELSSCGKWDNPVEGGKKEFLGSVGAIRDITKRKELEDSLRKSNDELRRKLRMKSQFLANVSHEFKNPLTSLKLSLDNLLVLMPDNLSEQQKRTLEVGKRSIDRLLRLVTDVLSQSAIESGRMEMRREKVNIQELIDEILIANESKIFKKGISITKDFESDIEPVWMDRDKIGGAIINILDNAIKYSPERGDIAVRLVDEGGNLRIEISDEGPGIPEEHLTRIFDQFERIDTDVKDGTGLGLAIAREIVELHRGSIRATSDGESGSVFTIVLPKDLRTEDGKRE